MAQYSALCLPESCRREFTNPTRGRKSRLASRPEIWIAWFRSVVVDRKLVPHVVIVNRIVSWLASVFSPPFIVQIVYLDCSSAITSDFFWSLHLRIERIHLKNGSSGCQDPSRLCQLPKDCSTIFLSALRLATTNHADYIQCPRPQSSLCFNESTDIGLCLLVGTLSNISCHI